MASETLEIKNAEWARVELKDANMKVQRAANFVGATKLFLTDGPNGAIVQGEDANGIRTIGRFPAPATIGNLDVLAKPANPTADPAKEPDKLMVVSLLSYSA